MVEPRTLNVPEQQVLLDFFEDENGFYWHHRLLLARGSGPGQWIVGTPDRGVEATLLTDHHVVPLRRGAPFPSDYAGEIYAFREDFPEAELNAMRTEARQLVEILGPAATGAGRDGTQWRISDPAHSEFASQVPEGALGDDAHFVSRGDAALVLLDDVWVTAERVAEGEVERWRERKVAGPGRDTRLLPDKRNASGVRAYDFSSALELMREPQGLAGWPFQGPRAASEYLQGLQRAGHTPTTYAESWERTSGVRAASAAAREHRGLLETIRLAIAYDQVNVPSMASMEYTVRRLVQLEAAVKRAPLSPDFSGLEHMLSQVVDASGAIHAAEFQKWSSGVMRDEAQVLKQTRLWNEEQSALARRGRERKGKGRGKKGDDAPPPAE